MKKLFFFVAFAALFVPKLAVAQSVFDGTWKIDMNKVDFSKKPDEFVPEERHVFVQDMRSTLRSESGRNGPTRQRASVL